MTVEAARDRSFLPTLAWGLMIAGFLALALAAVRYLTVEADEAWMLLSVGQLAGGPFAGRPVIAVPTLTSGGLYATLHYPLLVAGQPVAAHRAVSCLLAALTLALVYAIVRAEGAKPRVGAFAVVAFLTVPGFLLQAAMATAEMTATLLVLAGAWLWTARGEKTLAGGAATGLVFGLACATRTSAVVVLPAVLASAALVARANPRALAHALLATALAVVVLSLCAAAYCALFRAPVGVGVAGAAEFLGRTTGLVGARGRSAWLASVLISKSLFPLPVLVVVAAAVATGPPAGALAGTRSLCGLLVLIGAIGWIAWVARAPIPHLRYLWPALPALWLAGTLLLAGWLTTLGAGRPRLLIQAAVVAAFAAEVAISARQVVHGESLAVVYEAIGTTPVRARLGRLGAARRDQEALGPLLAGLPERGAVCALSPEFGYPVTLLTGRAIEALADRSEGRLNRACGYLVLFPADRTLWTPTWSTAEWIRRATRPVARFGDHSVYAIAPGAPDLVPPTVLPLGDQSPP